MARAGAATSTSAVKQSHSPKTRNRSPSWCRSSRPGATVDPGRRQVNGAAAGPWTGRRRTLSASAHSVPSITSS